MSVISRYLEGYGFRKYRNFDDLYSEPGLVFVCNKDESTRYIRNYYNVKHQLLHKSNISFDGNGGGETLYIFIKYIGDPNQRAGEYAIINEKICNPGLIAA